MEVKSKGSTDPQAPLVLLFHGRGSNAQEIIELANHLPQTATYVAANAPIFENGGYAWFANRGIGRPIAESINKHMNDFTNWLESFAPDREKIYLVGFSGGGAFAGGLMLSNKSRYAGAAILYATLPWDAEIPAEPNQLENFSVYLAHGEDDFVIPRELQDRTWQYLTRDSGATITTHKGPEGHGLTIESLQTLNDWLLGEFTKS